mmetsp:Transcript_45832/g.90289  ORF Transcript_45832/g.90289 Transcript_45832/m.90289 type:complete len:351 (-) Transcript_45832:1412-2464(-)
MVLAQEICPGGELFSVLMHAGAFPEDIARHYFKQLVEGLEYIHSQGVFHRDLKPENLVLDSNFVLKLIDFGLAATVEQSADGAADSPVLAEGLLHSGVGSQPYSAPEVYYSNELFPGQGYQGGPADIWSAAVILFVMLTGRPPFARPLTKTYGKAMKRCRHFSRLLKGQGFQDVSDEAKDLLMSMLQPCPSARPSIRSIKQSAWWSGPTPSQPQLDMFMMEQSVQVWKAQGKPEMIDLLHRIRAEAEVEDVARRSSASKTHAAPYHPHVSASPRCDFVDPSCSPPFSPSLSSSPSFSPSIAPFTPLDKGVQSSSMGELLHFSLNDLSDLSPFKLPSPSAFPVLSSSSSSS